MLAMAEFNLEYCARPNILKLVPYRCAREYAPPTLDYQTLIRDSDYKDDGKNILLDANENAYGPGLALDANGHLKAAGAEMDLQGLHRYPDPLEPRLPILKRC